MRVDFPRVAAAILAAVEGGILPPGMATLNAELTAKPTRESAGQDARLYGRRDARRYANQIPGPIVRPANVASLTSITARRYRVSGGFPSSVTETITWKLLPPASSGTCTVADGGPGPSG